MSGPRLSIIPARAATDPALKPRDLQVLCVLGRHTDELGWCTKSQVKMANEMGCARSTVFDAVERLVKAGYLERYVQESTNGRDSPHLYRVILDPKHPDLSRVPVDDSDASDPCRYTGTPADISAPPAGPESAPPAGPGPAPKNDPIRTTSSERDERERGREVDRRKIENAGWALLKDWPGFAGMPKEPALRMWCALSDDDRADAAKMFPHWLALLKAQKKSHVPAPSTYFGQRLWVDVPEPQEVKPTSVEAKPFGPLWMVARLKHLLAGATMRSDLTSFERGLVAEGRATEAELLLAKQSKTGFPAVNFMHEQAANRRGVSVSPALEAFASAMVAVPVRCDVYDQWRTLHERLGWPWLPDPGGQRVVYFPAGGPEGLDAFEAAMRGNGNDGDRREAAE